MTHPIFSGNDVGGAELTTSEAPAAIPAEDR